MPLPKSETPPHYDLELGVQLRFQVKIDTHDLKYWTSISGLDNKTEIIKYYPAEGMDHYNQLPGRKTWSNLKLTRACTKKDLEATFKWLHEFYYTSDPKKTTMHVKCLTAWGEPAGEWSFSGVWPVSWTGPGFDATKSQVATEVLELAHDGLFNAPSNSWHA